MRIGEMVLHGLEGADRLAELHAALGILDGQIDELTTEAQQLGGGGRRAAIEGGFDRGASLRPGRDPGRLTGRPLDGEGATAAVDGQLGREPHSIGRNGVQLVAVLQQQQVGGRRVRDDGVAFEPDGHTRLAGRDPGQPLLGHRSPHLGERGGGDRDDVRNRLGHCVAAALLEQKHEVERAETEPAVTLGRRQTEDPELGEVVPQPGDAAALRLPGIGERFVRALLREQLAHGLLHQALIFRELELHGATSSAGRGSARRRCCVGSRSCRPR